MAEGLTEEQAIALHESEFWADMTHRERAIFQLCEDRLCMPFNVFHEAVEKALDRPVFTHEFACNRDGMVRELAGRAAPPTFREVLEMIPEGKRVLVTAGESNG